MIYFRVGLGLIMKKYIFIFLALFCFTTGHASENLKRLSNAPQSITDSGVFREIDFTKATKYKSFHIPSQSKSKFIYFAILFL